MIKRLIHGLVVLTTLAAFPIVAHGIPFDSDDDGESSLGRT